MFDCYPGLGVAPSDQAEVRDGGMWLDACDPKTAGCVGLTGCKQWCASLGKSGTPFMLNNAVNIGDVSCSHAALITVGSQTQCIALANGGVDHSQYVAANDRWCDRIDGDDGYNPCTSKGLYYSDNDNTRLTGTASADAASCQECPDCPAGTYVSRVCTSSGRTRCRTCPPGTFNTETSAYDELSSCTSRCDEYCSRCHTRIIPTTLHSNVSEALPFSSR